MPRSPAVPVSIAKPPALAAPAVCRSGLCQFAPKQQFTNGPVQSRALFWCKSGYGEFVVNGVRYPMEPYDLYVLPWNRHIAYYPAKRNPMFTAHVHIIPWYRPGAAWRPVVPHAEHEAEFDSPDRSDADWPIPPGVARLRTRSDELLGQLIDYAVRWYLETKRDEADARALGLLVTKEICRATSGKLVSMENRPEELRRMLIHVDGGFHLGPTIQDLAVIINRSRSHVLKLFRRHMGISAKAYIINRQLREARELLLTTTHPIYEIGQRVGITDPYHFSRLFRSHVGLSPRKFRTMHGPFHGASKVIKTTRPPADAMAKGCA
jgi:AraC-like DNA-binding protein